jgi:hypothetical protein
MSEFSDEVLIRGLVDYIGFWEVLRISRRTLPDLDNESRRIMILDAILDLIEANHVALGAPTRAGEFVEWKMNPEEAIEEVSTKWSLLGRDPNVGEVVWLRLTEAGKKEALKLINR